MTTKKSFTFACVGIICLFAFAVFMFKSKPSQHSQNVPFFYTGFESERTKAAQLLEKEILNLKKNSDHPLKIGIAKANLNEDGISDIFVYLENFHDCPRHGCFTYAYIVNEKGDWQQVLSVMTHGDLAILHDKTLEYHDLSLGKVYDFDHPTQNKFAIWKWNGKKYDYNQVKTLKKGE